MIHDYILIILGLLFAVSMLVMIGQRLKIAYPIFLVIGGLLISLIPGVPRITINPELVFLIFLPPLLYEAAWYTPWFEFLKLRRPILLLAFGLVLFTSCIVAFVSSSIIPGFTMAMGFLLGGIISPPDAIAATTVLKGIKVPKRIITILEGESLINDASSLIVFRFALVAVISGTFSFQTATVNFFMVTLLGTGIGLAIAHIFYAIHRWMPTNANIDSALFLMAPYFMFLVAESFHVSGVMAVVSGGLFMSFRSQDFKDFAASRIQGAALFSTISYILNGLIFILIGLQLPIIIEGLGDYSFGEALGYALLISLLIVAIRIIWVYPATYLPRFFFRSIREKEQRPRYRQVFLVSWAGMRGVVSLASALSIPLLMEDKITPFPQRNLILFVTFVVILFTLVLQGLSIPWIIRKLDIGEAVSEDEEKEAEANIKLRMIRTSVEHIERHYGDAVEEHDLLRRLKIQLETDISVITKMIEEMECVEEQQKGLRLYKNLQREILALQRREIIMMRNEKVFDDELLRKQEARLDLEEVRMR